MDTVTSETFTKGFKDQQDKNESAAHEDETIMQFLDSTDNYITLITMMSSTLRQGWLDLASARHSMGSSRISASLFDLKEHSPSSVVQVKGLKTADKTCEGHPHFTLLKWGSCGQKKDDEGLHKQSYCSYLRHRGFPGDGENSRMNCESLFASEEQVQKERSKALSVFGALVSPKLRSAQVSFETVLETLMDIANARSVMLSTFDHLQQKKEGSI